MPSRLHTFRPRAVLLLALLLPGGCGGDRSSAGDQLRTYQVRGVYVAPQFGSEAALIDHEHIPGYMDAMRMALRLDDPAELEGLEPGAKIQFELVVTGDAQYVRSLQRLPDSTVLELHAPPAVE